MYRWEDKNGIVTFKETPPPPSKKNRVKVYTDSDFTAAPPAPVPTKNSGHRPPNTAQTSPAAEAKPVRPANPIEMYVTDWCGVCKRAEQYMASKNYPFVAYDIEKDTAAMKRYRDLGGRGVPLILLGSQKLAGFSGSAIDQYIQGR
jgi:glutaredoxin